MKPSTARLLSIVFPSITLIIVSFQPAGLQLSFLVSGILSSIQARAFATPSVREWLGMEPVPPPPDPSDNPIFQALGYGPKKPDPKPPTPTIKVQKRVVLASRPVAQKTLKYEAPTPIAGSTGSRRQLKKRAKTSILDSVKEGFKSKAEDFRTAARGMQERLGTTPEQEDKKEAERYEKRRRQEIEAEKEEKLRWESVKRKNSR